MNLRQSRIKDRSPRRSRRARSSSAASPAAGLVSCGILVGLTAALLLPSGGAATAHASQLARTRSRRPRTIRSCRTFREKKVRHGHLVRRHGRVVYVRVKKCTTVPSAECKVAWQKKRANGHLVIRNHNPVYVAKVSCPSSSGGLDKQAEKVLAMPQHKPPDIDLFGSQIRINGVPVTNSEVYPGGSRMDPAPGPKPTLSQVKSQLGSFLKERFGSNQSEIDKALDTFNSSKGKSLIPDPTLRAAFAAMRGTTFQPTIDYFLNSGNFTGMQFGPTDSLLGISQTKQDLQGKRTITVNDRYRNEPFSYLIPMLGHEIQHGSPASQADEAFCNFESAMVINEVLAEHPKLAYRDTELARVMNSFALMFLNSRHPGSAQNVIIAPDGRGLFPGSTAFANKDVWSLYHGSGISLAPSVARTVLRSILPGVTLPTPLNYDESTAKLFEHLKDPYLSPTTRLRNAVLLQLVSVSQIAHKLGITNSQAISKFRLQPILKVVHAGQYGP